MWFGRGAEEIAAGLARALAVWVGAKRSSAKLRLLVASLGLIFAWRLRRLLRRPCSI